MEKNIQDDRLDDYVKKSFEDYSEEPSFDMWDRIDGQLTPAVAPRPMWYSLSRYRWQMAAAVAILALFSRLICVQTYYEGKLRDISLQQEKTMDQKVTEPNPALVAPNNVANENTREKILPPAAPVVANNATFEKNIPAASQQTATASTLSKHLSLPEITTAPVATDNTIQENQTGTAAVQQEDNPTIPTLAAPAAASLASAETHKQITGFQPLDQKNTTLSVLRNCTPFTVETPIKPHKNSNGWYVGLAVSPHLMVERANQPRRPGPFQNPRRLYANQQDHPQFSAEAWVRVGKKINSRFGLESGVGFQQFTRTATHRPKFEYLEGQSIQNPNGTESRSFDYDLNTYGGAASVTLRTEVSGNDTPTEHEKIGVHITSTEQIQMIRIPVLGVGRFGNGRAQAVVKAGILGSYLAKNQFEITANTLENNKLAFQQNDGYTVQFNRPQHFILGYLASAGVEFKVNRSLSLTAAPTLSGDFARTDPEQGKLPGHTAVGMNVGANWWF